MDEQNQGGVVMPAGLTNPPTDETGNVATQSVPISGSLQPPAAAPAPKPIMLAPAEPPATKNPTLHGFVSSVLTALSGGPAKNYATDSSGRLVQTATDRTTGQKVAKIFDNALAGLGAGAQVSPRASGAASALAGAGAGAAAVQSKAKAEDVQAKLQAREDFDAAQKAKLQQHEIMKGNALTARNWAEAQKLQSDLDESRTAAKSITAAAEKAGVPGLRTVSESEWQGMLQSDPDILHKYIHLPAGFAPSTTDSEGNMKPGEGQITLIPATGDNEIAMPKEYLGQAEKYAPLSGLLTKDDIKRMEADQGVPVNKLPALISAIEQGRSKWLEGESQPKLVWTQDGKFPQLVNKYTSDPVGYMKPGQISEEAETAVEKKEAEKSKSDLEKAQAFEAGAKGKEALANAAVAANIANLGKGSSTPEAEQNLLKSYNNLPPTAKGMLQNLDKSMQATVLSTWAGRTDPKSLTQTPRKGTGQLSRQQIESVITQMDPTWRENKYEEVKKLEEEYINPKSLGANVIGFGQLLRHSAEAVDIAKQLSQTNALILNMPLNEARRYLGNQDAAKLAQMETALTAVSNEWSNVIKNQHAENVQEAKARTELVNASSPLSVKLAAIQTMGNQAVDRLGEVDNPYVTLTGMHYPGLISPGAREAAKKLGLDSRLTEFGPGGQLFTGASPLVQPNSPAATVSGLTNLHTNGSLTIGWDGKQWVDSATGKPYTGAQ